MKKKFLLFLLVLLPFLAFAEGSKETIENKSATASVNKAKYVFLFIGDGMAIPQINAAEAYLAANDSSPGIEKLTFTQFPSSGLTTTYDAGSFITDSASAATAMATGNKTLSGVISMDPSKTVKFTTISEIAKDAGMKVGIVSSVNLDHATPAAFYAKQASRNDYYDIGVQMANSDFDYYAGGLIRTTKTPSGKEAVLDIMAENGWTIATSKNEFNALTPSNNQVYAYYDTSFTINSLDYAMDMEADDITLAEYTKKGIELLDNENGFFMMIEGGKIDWACHANDAAASIHNTVAFDSAIKEAVKFYNTHPEETLIVVTGDHETGGLTLGFAGTKYDSAFDNIDNQKMSFEAFNQYVLGPYKESAGKGGSFADVLPAIDEYFGLTDLSEYETKMLTAAYGQSMMDSDVRAQNDETYLLYGGYEPFTIALTHILNQRAGLAWTSYSHTGVPVQTFALGASDELFNGYYDNTDIFNKIKAIMNL